MVDSTNNNNPSNAVNINVAGTADPTLSQLTQKIDAFEKSLGQLTKTLQGYDNATNHLNSNLGTRISALQKNISSIQKSINILDGGVNLRANAAIANFRGSSKNLLDAKTQIGVGRELNTFAQKYTDDLLRSAEQTILRGLKSASSPSKNTKFQQELRAFYEQGNGNVINKAMNRIQGRLSAGNITANRDMRTVRDSVGKVSSDYKKEATLDKQWKNLNDKAFQDQLSALGLSRDQIGRMRQLEKQSDRLNDKEYQAKKADILQRQENINRYDQAKKTKDRWSDPQYTSNIKDANLTKDQVKRFHDLELKKDRLNDKEYQRQLSDLNLNTKQISTLRNIDVQKQQLGNKGIQDAKNDLAVQTDRVNRTRRENTIRNNGTESQKKTLDNKDVLDRSKSNSIDSRINKTKETEEVKKLLTNQQEFNKLLTGYNTAAQVQNTTFNKGDFNTRINQLKENRAILNSALNLTTDKDLKNKIQNALGDSKREMTALNSRINREQAPKKPLVSAEDKALQNELNKQQVAKSQAVQREQEVTRNLQNKNKIDNITANANRNLDAQEATLRNANVQARRARLQREKQNIRESDIALNGTATERMSLLRKQAVEQRLSNNAIFNAEREALKNKLTSQTSKILTANEKARLAKDDSLVFSPFNTPSSVGANTNWTTSQAASRMNDIKQQQDLLNQRRMTANATGNTSEITRINSHLDGLSQELKAIKPIFNKLANNEIKNTPFAQAQRQQNQAANLQQRNSGEGRAQSFMGRFSYLTDYMMAGAGIGAIAGSYNFLKEFEAALKQTQAIASATDGQMVGLKKSIMEVSDTSRFSAIQLSEAATTLAQAGFNVKDIQTSLASVATLATATGSSLSESVDLSTSVLSAFKMSAESLPEVVNQITQAMNMSKLDIQKFMLTTQYAANSAADLGINFREMLSATAAVSNTGIKSGSTMGTGMRQLLADLSAPTEKFKNKLKDLGLSVADIDVRTNGLTGALKNLKQAGFSTADAFDSFELRATAYYIALSNNLKSYDELYSAMDNTSAATKAQDVQMNSLAAQTDRFSNQLKLLVEVLGSDLRTTLTDVTRSLADFLKTLTEALEDGVIAKVVKFTVAMAGLFAIFKVIAVVGKTVAAVIGLLAGVGGAGAAVGFAATIARFGKLNLVLLGVSASLAALSVALDYFESDMEKSKEAVKKAETGYNDAKDAINATSTAITQINEQIKSTNARTDILSKSSSELANGFTEVRNKAQELGIHLETELGGSVDNLKKAWIELRSEMEKTMGTQLETEQYALQKLSSARSDKLQETAGETSKIIKEESWKNSKRFSPTSNINNLNGMSFDSLERKNLTERLAFIDPSNPDKIIQSGMRGGSYISLSSNRNDLNKDFDRNKLKNSDSDINSLISTMNYIVKNNSINLKEGTKDSYSKSIVPLIQMTQPEFIKGLEFDEDGTRKYFEQLKEARSTVGGIQGEWLKTLIAKQRNLNKDSEEYKNLDSEINLVKSSTNALMDRILNIFEYVNDLNNIAINKAKISGNSTQQKITAAESATIGSSNSNISANSKTGALTFETYSPKAGKVKTTFTPEQQRIGKVIYDAAMSKGLSSDQASAFLGEVFRENSFNPKAMFGTHSDKNNSKSNFGIISMQGGREVGLKKSLTQQGLMQKDGTAVNSDESLKAMVDYILTEDFVKNNDASRKFLQTKEASSEEYKKLFGGAGSAIAWDRYNKSGIGVKGAQSGEARIDAGSALGKYLSGGLPVPERSSVVGAYKIDTKDENSLRSQMNFIQSLENTKTNLQQEKELLEKNNASKQEIANKAAEIDTYDTNIGLKKEQFNIFKDSISKTSNEDREVDLKTRAIESIILDQAITNLQDQLTKATDTARPDVSFLTKKSAELFDKQVEKLKYDTQTQLINSGKTIGNLLVLDTLDVRKIDAEKDLSLQKMYKEYSDKLTQMTITSIQLEVEIKQKANEKYLANLKVLEDNRLQNIEIANAKLLEPQIREVSNLKANLDNMQLTKNEGKYSQMELAVFQRDYDTRNEDLTRNSDIYDATNSINKINSTIKLANESYSREKAQQSTLDTAMQKLKEESDLYGRDTSKAQKENETQRNESVVKENGFLNEAKKATLELNKQQIILNNLLKDSPDQISLLKQLYETYAYENKLYDSVAAGNDRVKSNIDSLKEGFISLGETIASQSDNVDDFFKHLLGGTSKGKEAWKEMLFSWVSDLMKAQALKMLNKMLENMLGSIQNYTSQGQGANGSMTGGQKVVSFLGTIASAVLGGSMGSGASPNSGISVGNGVTVTPQPSMFRPTGITSTPLSGLSSGGKVALGTHRKRYSTGGKIADTGIPNRDSVPVLAQPDEFMIRQPSARLLGDDFLNGLNNQPATTMKAITAKPKINVDNYQETSVYVVTPDQKPANISPNQIIAIVADSLDRKGSLNQKIKTLVNKG